jgi:hypothetical protein
MSIESTVGVTEIVYETPHTLPNGAVVSKSVLPISPLLQRTEQWNKSCNGESISK